MTEVVFIHGILGKPDFFDFLRPYIPADGFHSVDILLEGHCATPQDFARASMARWRGQVDATVQRLRADGRRIVIAAHSMGTLFAIDSAVRGMADALFLLNPPLGLRPSLRMAATSLKVFMGKTDDPLAAAAKAAYSLSDDRNPLHYIGWIPRYLELFAEIRRTRAIVARLAVPTLAFLSARDEIVSPSSGRRFPLRPDITVATLPNSGHYYYPEPDRSRLTDAFCRLLEA